MPRRGVSRFVRLPSERGPGSAIPPPVARSQRWSAARANRRPAPTRLAPANAYTPTFAAEDGFPWAGLRPLRERCSSRRGACLLLRDPAVVCRRAVVAPRVLLAEPLGRFGVGVVALRLVPPEPVSVAALDLPRERSRFVVLALARRALLLGRVWASARLVWLARVDGAFLGLRASRRSDVMPGSAAVLDRARLDLPSEPSAVAGTVLPRLAVLAPGLFAARRPASGFLCVDARAPCRRSTSAST